MIPERPTLQDLAEDAFAWMEGPRVELAWRDEFVLRNAPNPSPMLGMVLRPRLADVDAGLAAARAWFAERGRKRYSWWISDASEPSDLADQLLARGLTPDEDPVAAGMLLEREPEGVDGVEVHKIDSFDEALACAKITWSSFHMSDEEIEAATNAIRETFPLWQEFEGSDRFAALLDGEIVGSGGAFYLPGAVYLVAGNVAEHARGRGVYRALVRARWDEAVRRGTPALVVQAGKMSKPILERLGFQTVCEVRILVDSTA